MNIFHKIHETQGRTIILITHEMQLASETQRIITLKDGEIIGEKNNDSKNRFSLV